MTGIGPTDFSAATGLSPKALRLYEERGLLRPAFVDPVTGYRRYAASQLDVAARIALLRRAGIGLADIQRFLGSPSASRLDAWLGELNAEVSERRHALEALAYSLGLRPTQTRESTVPVTIHPISSLEELAEVFDLLGQQFDPPFDRSDGRRFGDLQAAFPNSVTFCSLPRQGKRLSAARSASRLAKLAPRSASSRLSHPTSGRE